MTPEELQAAQDAAVEVAADRQLTPHPGGVPGRVANAQTQAEQAIAAGDIDDAIGAEQLAAALTYAALTADN